jgi:hypothetical protein
LAPRVEALHYNQFVPSLKPQNVSQQRPKRHAVFASETMGLLLIALIVLIVTLVRYWQNIHWSWR